MSPRWTPEQKLRAEVKKLVRQIRGDARAAKRDKATCDVCLGRATLPCSSREHWLCDHCLLDPACGCTAPSPSP